MAICDNKLLNRGRIDAAVWEDVRSLLLDPSRLAAEHQRRLDGPAEPDDPKAMSATKKVAAVRRSIARLIDSYQDGYLEKEEFEPRIGGLRERLAQLEATAAGLANRERSEEEVRQVIGAIEQFASGVRERLDSSDFTTQRDLIRTLVDRIEVREDSVRIVYKVNIGPFERGPSRGHLQHYPTSLADHGVDAACGKLGATEVLDTDVGLGMKCASDKAREGIQFDTDEPHALRCQAQESPSAATRLKDRGGWSDAQAGERFVHGPDHGGRGVEGVERGAFGRVVLPRGQQR